MWRLRTQQRLWSTFSKKRGLNRKAGPPMHDDLVERVFTATRLNQLWLTDVTEHWTDEGKLYLCAIKDVRSNKIVGYSIDDRMKASLAVAWLNCAINARAHAGTFVRSDRGSQFRSRVFVKTLADNGMNGSMGRVGACTNNAAMESFFPAAKQRAEPAAFAAYMKFQLNLQQTHHRTMASRVDNATLTSRGLHHSTRRDPGVP